MTNEKINNAVGSVRCDWNLKERFTTLPRVEIGANRFLKMGVDRQTLLKLVKQGVSALTRSFLPAA